MPEPKVLLSGLGIPESPRWHEGRLWFCNWIDRQVLAVGLDGKAEVSSARSPVQLMGYSIDWLPDGRLLMTGDKLRRQEPDGSLVTVAGQKANEIVVDGRGNVYLNGADFNFAGGEAPTPGYIKLLTPDGQMRQVADDIAFPNGMVITPDNRTLIISESFARQLTAFDIDPDGGLSGRRVFAGNLGPDGICLDAEGAVWVSTGQSSIVRVAEGGEVLQRVELDEDRAPFALMLGGPDRRTLFILTAEWRPADAVTANLDRLTNGPRTGKILTLPVEVPGAPALTGQATHGSVRRRRRLPDAHGRSSRNRGSAAHGRPHRSLAGLRLDPVPPGSGGRLRKLPGVTPACHRVIANWPSSAQAGFYHRTMRSPLPSVLRPATWDLGTPSSGPAMTALYTIIARVVVIVRGITLAEIVVQVVIWRSFYLASPWLLWGPAAALAWGSTSMAYLRRHRPGWQLVCTDSAVYTGLALGAAWCVPAAIRGEAGSWLFIVVTTQSVAPVWFAPRALSVPLAIAPGIAFGVGNALAPATALVTASPRRASLALLFVVVATHWLIRQMLCARAARADAALAAADQEARDQYVVLSENIERREQDRLMHDTILNTLTAIARSGGTPAAISQCRQDIGLLQSALSDSDTTHGRGRAGPGPVEAIETVVGEMRARGLAVDLEIDGGAAAHGTPEPGLVPGPVLTAIAHATREALANVAAHAGTGQAWVTVSVTSPGEPRTVPQIQVTVRDEGAGFAPGSVDPARLGVRRSITERVEDWGGSAWVRSAPGEGTTVSLCWPADDTGVGPAGLQAAGAAGRGEPAQW